ncbi:MAG: Regulatory protein AtoC [Syntrophus sp. SKADARSKE-3]|nr:Regulatory protein AtoC [Syntrophus sp. SKADARSKE-3]
MSTILIIDDDESSRESLEMYFSEIGFDVVTASTGEQGVKKYRDNKIDVVILDIRLPDKDGFDVIDDLRVRQDDVKVIMITAYHDEQTILRAKEKGSFAYIKKPIDLDELDRVVHLALSAISS